MEKLTIEKQKLFNNIILFEYSNYINEIINSYERVFLDKKEIPITNYIRNIGVSLTENDIDYKSESLEVKVRKEYHKEVENIFQQIPKKEFLAKNSINRNLLRKEVSKLLKKFIEQKSFDNYSTLFILFNRFEYFGVNLKYLSKEINGVIKEIVKNDNTKKVHEVLELINKGVYIDERFLTLINLNILKMEEFKKQNKLNEIELNYDKMAYSIKNKNKENIKKFKI